MNNLTIRTLLLIFGVMTVSPCNSLRAQKLESYKQICLKTRSAIKSEDLGELRSCRDSLKDMKIKEYPPEKFITISPENEEPLDGHTLFHHKYLTKLIKIGIEKRYQIPADIHIGTRGENDVLITHRVVPANGEGKYKFSGKQFMEIAVISEDETPIEIIIECMDGNIVYESGKPSIPGCQEYKWVMGEDYSDIFLSIINPSATSICCVIATN